MHWVTSSKCSSQPPPDMPEGVPGTSSGRDRPTARSRAACRCRQHWVLRGRVLHVLTLSPAQRPRTGRNLTTCPKTMTIPPTHSTCTPPSTASAPLLATTLLPFCSCPCPRPFPCPCVLCVLQAKRGTGPKAGRLASSPPRGGRGLNIHRGGRALRRGGWVGPASVGLARRLGLARRQGQGSCLLGALPHVWGGADSPGTQGAGWVLGRERPGWIGGGAG